MLLREKFPKWWTNSYFFNNIKEFLGANVDPLTLSHMYFGQHSVYKECTNIFDILYPDIENYDAGDIIGMYGHSWKRIYDAIMQEYDALENYDKKEEETVKDSSEETRNTTKTGSEDNTFNSSEEEKEKKNGTNTAKHTEDNTIKDDSNTENKTSAYNVNTYQPDSESILDGTKKEDILNNDEETITSTGDITRTKADTATASTSESGSESMKGSNDRIRTLRTHGNIGVTTSQQMLQSELELREYNFWQKVFKDIDKTIAVLVY